jgi:hypothetical protein
VGWQDIQTLKLLQCLNYREVIFIFLKNGKGFIMSKTVLIIDGDIVAFRSAAIAEERSILVTHQPTGIEKSFKNRTEFKKAMKERNKEITSDYSVTDVQDAVSPAVCNKTIKQIIENFKKAVQPDSTEIYIGGKGNFRDDLPLPVKYKSHRAGNIRPLLLADAKSYMKRACGALSHDGIEADDVLSIRGYEELAKGNKPVLATFDHDAQGHSGLWVYNFNEENAVPKEIPQLGEIYSKNSDFHGTGLKMLAAQICGGDRSDGYRAYDLSEVKFGAKKVIDLLQPCQTEKEVLEAVVSQFRKFYPEEFVYTAWDGTEHKADYKSMLSLYFQCAMMKRTWDDDLDYIKFLNSYGVQT